MERYEWIKFSCTRYKLTAVRHKTRNYENNAIEKDNTIHKSENTNKQKICREKTFRPLKLFTNV